jgi:hypothetical protein
MGRRRIPVAVGSGFFFRVATQIAVITTNMVLKELTAVPNHGNLAMAHTVGLFMNHCTPNKAAVNARAVTTIAAQKDRAIRTQRTPVRRPVLPSSA